MNIFTKRSPQVIVLFGFTLFLFLVSCLRDDFDFKKFTKPDLYPELAAPLVHSDLNLAKILPKGSQIIEDSITHNLVLIYEQEVFSKRAQDYIQIPNQQQSFTENQIMLPVPTGTHLNLSFNEYLDFSTSVPNQRIDSISFKTATVDLSFTSNINHNASIEITIPSAIKNGQVFTVTIPHVYSGTLPVTNQASLDLSGYMITLGTGTSGQKAILIQYTLFVTGDNNPDQSPYTFQLSANISQIQFSKIFGYLGQYDYQMKDSVEISIFKNTIHGDVNFAALRLNLITSNSIGMPILLHFNELKAFSAKTPPYVVDIMNNPGFINPVTFPSPDIYHIGQQVDTTITFTSTNANLNQALNICPNYIRFDISGKSNPTGDTNVENFVLDTSLYKIKIKVELPLFGSIAGLWIQDTIKFSFTDIDKIQEFTFLIKTVNRFPLDAWMQLYFADEQAIIIDSLNYANSPYLIHAAAVGPPPDYYVPLSPLPEPYFFYSSPINRIRLNRLRDCKNLIIKAGLNTFNNGLVKLYNDYSLDVRMGAVIKFRY